MGPSMLGVRRWMSSYDECCWCRRSHRNGRGRSRDARIEMRTDELYLYAASTHGGMEKRGVKGP